MPPKKEAPAPEPVEDEVEAEKPKPPMLYGVILTPQKVKLLGGLEEDAEDAKIRHRNAELSQDVKLLELQKRKQLEQDGNKEEGQKDIKGRVLDLGSSGPQATDKFCRSIAPPPSEAAKAAVMAATATMGTSSSSGSLRPPSPGMSPTASSWRSSSTSTLKGSASQGSLFTTSLQRAGAYSMDLSRATGRLMQDMQLAQGSDLAKSSHRLRCEHVDKMHQFLKTHEPKERGREKASGPAFLTFSKDDRVMTGSLRAEPNERRYAPLPWQVVKQQPGWLSRSSSSPSLTSGAPLSSTDAAVPPATPAGEAPGGTTSPTEAPN
eukprot:TRINITY_DN12020_c0_g3_i1.p1 TRINITY_DN12020_c0_g3~~TRINITY_DN12020_c0_g3_i1.p1  ORF type:complete len:321 (-),score=87.74 TRINITY_DN12020_c0_g3_i1:62-1024(-)